MRNTISCTLSSVTLRVSLRCACLVSCICQLWLYLALRRYASSPLSDSAACRSSGVASDLVASASASLSMSCTTNLQYGYVTPRS